LHSENSAASSSIYKKHQKSAATRLGGYHLVTAQVHDQVVDAGADKGDDGCLSDGIQVDGRVLAQPGVEDGKPGGEARENAVGY
jgi:hypothetical protein